MKILVLGGTQFFGVPMVKELIAMGHEVTVATRGRRKDSFGESVNRVAVNRVDADAMKEAFAGMHFDVVIDKLGFCSNDVKILMDAVDADKYIHMSSTAVYEGFTMDTKEEDFDPAKKELLWIGRRDGSYEEIKRQAECALAQAYADKKWAAVRYPFVIGKHDYTMRLFFYVEHVMNEKPMFIDNIDAQMGLIGEEEGGKFLAYLAEQDVTGPINGCNGGTISMAEVIAYVEEKTGKKAVLADDGEPAPYNGMPDYAINTDKAAACGFAFSPLKDWIYDLVDFYIDMVKQQA